MSSLRNETVNPSRWVAIWAGMLVCWGIGTLAIQRVHRIRADPTLLRRRAAPARARAELENTASLLNSGSAGETCDSLRRAITGLIADFANVPEAGITPRDAANRLKVLGIEESLRKKIHDLLTDCDAARYGTAAGDAARLHDDAASLVDQLISQLKKSNGATSSPARSATTALLLFGVISAGCSTAPDLETSRKFQEAEQAFSQATTLEDYSRVARQYDQIGGEQFESGALLFNQGNAWMRANETGRAIASYRQSQRFRPRDPYLTANLQNAFASSGRSAESSFSAGIAAYVFFWQDWLSYPEKFAVATVLLAVTLIIALLSHLTTYQVLLRRASFATGVLCLLSITSAGWDWQRFDRTTYGVVTSDEIIARKGNSQSYEAAFTDPLPEGTEFIVLEERNDWLHVNVGDATTGWLPLRDVGCILIGRAERRTVSAWNSKTKRPKMRR